MRPAFDALFAIEDALADVIGRASDAQLARIKLAWWRERLEELDAGKVPAEPRLRQAARELLPRDVSGADLAGLEEGWVGLLFDPPDIALVTEHGTRLFALAARLLDVPFDDATIGGAGRLFAGVDASRRGLAAIARGSFDSDSPAMPRAARRLTALAALAARDLKRGGPPFEPEATPGRAWTLLHHRLTGRFPR